MGIPVPKKKWRKRGPSISHHLKGKQKRVHHDQVVRRGASPSVLGPEDQDPVGDDVSNAIEGVDGVDEQGIDAGEVNFGGGDAPQVIRAENRNVQNPVNGRAVHK